MNLILNVLVSSIIEALSQMRILMNHGSSIFMKKDNSEYYIKVKDHMKGLPRPKHRTRIIATPDEWLPIITVTLEALE